MTVAYSEFPEVCRDSRLLDQVRKHPFPLLFATISGAHLYGFPSSNSDFDLRGAHILPLEQVVGLRVGQSTIEHTGISQGWEIDLVTHDVHKFFNLLARPNGYVLEQVLSPLVVQTSKEHQQLKVIARRCITKHHAHHYLGFAATQWKLLEKDPQPRVKPLLYLYRVLLTGIHLMRTGEVQANLIQLNQQFGLTWIDELISAKVEGCEKELLPASSLQFHRTQYEKLVHLLRESHDSTNLPESPAGKEDLHDLLVSIRLSAHRLE